MFLRKRGAMSDHTIKIIIYLAILGAAIAVAVLAINKIG